MFNELPWVRKTKTVMKRFFFKAKRWIDDMNLHKKEANSARIVTYVSYRFKSWFTRDFAVNHTDPNGGTHWRGSPKSRFFEKNRENLRKIEKNRETQNSISRKIKKNKPRNAIKSWILMYFSIGFLVYLGSPISGYPPLGPYDCPSVYPLFSLSHCPM